MYDGSRLAIALVARGSLAWALLASGAFAEEVRIDGPPPPIPPAVVARDAEGRVTMRAIRLDAPLAIDGRLEERVYHTVPSVGGFVQQDPREGEPASEDTEIWVFFDDQNLYVGARCWDSQPERIRANEMRRDHVGLFENDNFAILFDTFYDRRNAFIFHVNALGGLFDAQVIDETHFNRDWNSVWNAKTIIDGNGWTIEMVIPFKSLRYRTSGPQIWGVSARRIVRSKNELSHLTPIPASYGSRGILKVSSAATLVGVETPPRSKNLEVKPYAISDLRTDRRAVPAVADELDGDWGLDLKYGLTRGLTFDLTYNTDFAQVEVDEQQVNLTRFSLFFPEKRDFFLEGQGIFQFGTAGSQSSTAPSNTPTLFFSRRIGLEDGRPVPIRGGGRLTGRAGPYTIGLLDIHTEPLPIAGVGATHFSVVRVKRDILRRSNIGVIATRRDPARPGNDTNLVYGMDADLAFFQNLRINAYYARSETPDLEDRDASYRTQLDYAGDRWGLVLERLVVEENFRPEMGFLRRQDFRRSFGQFRFSPRPRSLEWVRKLTWEASFDYITDNEDRLETRVLQGAFLLDFENSDQVGLEYQRNLEFLPSAFPIAPGVVLPVGEYRFQDARYHYKLGPQRAAPGEAFVRIGTFFSGRRSAVGYRGRIELSRHLSVEPGLEVNWVSLEEGRFDTRLVSARINYMMSPRAILSALSQFNSSNDSFSTNVRFRWEYEPGSDLFVVYSDGRDTLGAGFPTLANRSLVVKLTRLFRF